MHEADVGLRKVGRAGSDEAGCNGRFVVTHIEDLTWLTPRVEDSDTKLYVIDTDSF